LQGGVEHLAGFGMLAAGGGKAVDHQVHLAQVLFDEVDGLVLDLVGKGVAIDAFGVEASLLGAFMEGGGVVPAGGAGLALGPFLLEENAEGRSEEHTSELQSRENLVCRLLLEKKKEERWEICRYYLREPLQRDVCSG